MLGEKQSASTGLRKQKRLLETKMSRGKEIGQAIEVSMNKDLHVLKFQEWLAGSLCHTCLIIF